MMFRSWKQDCEQTELPEHPALNDLSQPYNLIKPNSHCPKCHAPVKAWQNIPVLSWLVLRGKCTGCSTNISVRYPLVELTTAVLSAVLLVKDRKSTRLNSSHVRISYAVFCLKKKKKI